MRRTQAVPVNLPGSRPTMPAAPDVIIPDRAEFIDALHQLRRGRTLVRAPDDTQRCVLDGAVLYTAYAPLAAYGLLEEVRKPSEVSRLHCYRLSARGRAFADRACSEWKRRPLLQRLAVRLTG
jgi:hypothetical protein